jgi:hypothetical protein
MYKKIILVLLALLIVPVSSVAAQTEVLTVEELTEKVADLEFRIQTLEDFMMLFEPGAGEIPAPVAKTEFKVYGIGDIVESTDRTVSLNSAILKDGVLEINVTVTNTSNGQIETGGTYAFNAKNDDGVMFEKDYSCPSSSLDVVLIPGDKVKGTVCFTYSDPAPIKIYYEPDYMREEIIVWSISK